MRRITVFPFLFVFQCVACVERLPRQDGGGRDLRGKGIGFGAQRRFDVQGCLCLGGNPFERDTQDGQRDAPQQEDEAQRAGGAWDELLEFDD